MEWRRNGSASSDDRWKLPQQLRSRLVFIARHTPGIRRWVIAGAVLLTLLSALLGAARPESVGAQRAITRISIASAQGDGWTDATGNSGSAVCGLRTNTDGSCSPAAWGQLITDAEWIWKSSGISLPAEQLTFAKTFTIPADAYDITATMHITADNAYEATFNGTFIGGDGSMDLSTQETGTFSWTSVESYDLTVLPGENRLDVLAANHVPTSETYNFAGLLYRIDIVYLQGILDTTSPVVTVPSEIGTDATGPDGAHVTYTVSATDDVDGAIAVSCAPESGSLFPIGMTTVNCTATDSAWNVGRASFVVTVMDVADTMPPTVSVPNDVVTDATGPNGAYVEYLATAADDVDGAIAVSCEPASGALFSIGATTVTCTATDSAGNVGSASFVVTVRGVAAQLDELIAVVANYNLHQGISNSLDSKLSNARTALDAASAGDLGGACGKLAAFINEVQAQADKKLTLDQANDLIARASRIAAVLGC